ncbi:MAG: hypothetical protein NTV34_15900, partial [Proteobacteria bacterium]|nr:hypothetical protein [Pseudomonadota bacterium]
QDANPSTPLPTEEPPFDFEKTCGLKKAAEDADPDRVLFSSNLKSLPIVSEGTQLGATFRVVMTATTKIEARAKTGAKVDLQLKLDNVDISASSALIKKFGPIIAKVKATDQAKKLSGPVTGTSLPMGQWLNLVTAGGQYENLLCGVSPATIKQVSLSGDKEGVIEWTPALPTSLNPLAPRETFEKEIGPGRTFQVVGKITTSKDGWPKIGEYPTTVIIKPIAPNFTSSDGKTYAGDIAYEVSIKATLDPKHKGVDPISNIRSYFINLKDHTFDVIVDSTQQTVENIKSPVIVLLKQ